MASRRIKLISAVALAGLGMSCYLLYSVFASPVDAGSELAQEPLNDRVQVPPAFIMAVDDSGSMTFETLFTPQDGTAFWDTGTASTNGYFNSDGTFRESGTGNNHHLIPHSGGNYRIGTNRYAIPPIDNFGFSRSHEYNPQYYDPNTTYQPWLNEDGSPHTNADTDAEGNAVATSVRVDPRNASPVIDFTQVRAEAGSAQLRFRVMNGTTLPAGTTYYRAGSSCGGLAQTDNTGTPWRTLDNPHPLTGNCEIGISYFPAVFYLKEDTAVPDGFDSNARIGPIPHAGGPNISMYKYEIRPENYTSPEAYDAAIQNFANWYSYYGNRTRSMIASMSHALVNVNNMRVGYFTINQHASRINPVGNVNHRVTMYDMRPGSGDRAALYTQMFGLPASGGTPNRQAVEAMGQQFLRTDGGAPVQLACQKNAGMLFTDGYSNTNGPTVGNIDEDLGFPFEDDHSNTLADIATQYYLDNLRPDLAAGQVPVPQACSSDDPEVRLDCNANPHMNFYGITLGATGEAYGVTHFNASEGYTNPPAWPPRTNDTRATIDDIWHATINTRGEYINAYTPEDVTNAMRRILQAVSSGDSPSGSIALTGARIGTGSLTVVPRYEVLGDGTDWHGDLEANVVSVVPGTPEVVFGEGWKASENIPGPDARRVYFARDNDVLPFNADNVSFEDLCEKPPGLYRGDMSLCGAATPGGPTGLHGLGFTIGDVVSYLLGDDEHEGVGPGHLRERTTRIGDIVNSTPVISAPTDDYGYRSLGTHGGVNFSDSYDSYLDGKLNRRYMVYVGANDGMLHAFDGGMGANDTDMDGDGGREVFAYVPATALGHMGNLLIPNDPANENDQKFQHRYYVDGPITVSDAYFPGAGSNWRTVLVGTTGAGGRSVFALDVSDPSGFDEGSRLWEISDLDESLDPDVRDDIGHVLGTPVIVPIRTAAGGARWVAIFGNGYKSANDQAVLFVVDIASGDIQTIPAVESGYPGPSSDGNGLGNIVVVDRWGVGADGDPSQMRDGLADTVYAADLRGAIWKFDLRDMSASSQPLFVTQEVQGGNGRRQPITGGLAAATGPMGGVMLYFGTGSFAFESDPEDDTIQSLYAINDIERGPTQATIGLGDLIHWDVAILDDGGRTVERQGAGAFAERGWYVNLPAGERSVGYPNIAGGTLFIPTYVPDPNAEGCSAGGMNWLFGLNARTGAAGLSSVYDSPGDDTSSHSSGTAAVELETGGTAPVRDVAVFTVPPLGPAVPDPSDPTAGPPTVPGRNCWMLVAVAGADPMYVPYPCGRQSWRQIQ